MPGHILEISAHWVKTVARKCCVRHLEDHICGPAFDVCYAGDIKAHVPLLHLANWNKLKVEAVPNVHSRPVGRRSLAWTAR